MMVINVEQTFLDRFRKLSLEKQGDVLQFLDFIEQDLSEKPTDVEIQEARKILTQAKQKAVLNSPKSAEELWDEFNQVKNAITKWRAKHDRPRV